MADALVIWTALLLGAIGTGASFVGILVAKRSMEGVFASTGLLAFVLCAWGFGNVTVAYDRLDAIVYAFVFGLAGIAGGYALVSTLLGLLARSQPIPSLPTVEHLPPNPGSSAVLVLGEVESEQYSATATARALEDLSDEGLLSASIGVLPFLFMAQKTRYRAAGGASPAAKQLQQIAERLEAMLAGAEHPASVESVWAEGERSLVARVAAQVSRGVRQIIVAEAIIAESLEVDEAKRRVDALRLSDLGVAVTYAGPLWGSGRLAAAVANRIMAVLPEATFSGVVLVGQGQPDERARDWREFDEQETAFLNHVRMLLVERGLDESNVRIAWADWRAPEVTGAVRHLAALGCRRVVVSPACFPLGSITTLLDLQLSVRQARVEEMVSVVTLPAYYDDPALTEELRASVLRATGGSPAAPAPAPASE